MWVKYKGILMMAGETSRAVRRYALLGNFGTLRFRKSAGISSILSEVL